MNMDWSWRALVRLLLQALAIVLPIAFYLRTYDSCMIKITFLQLGTLAALTVWAVGVLEEGRLELPSRALPVLGPAVLLLAWNALRFAFAEHRWAVLNGFATQECFLLAVILALAVFSRRDLRQAVGVILGSWAVVVLYGFLQCLGLDPFVWKGAFGTRVFSTMGNPNFLASYLLVCAPLALAWALDDELPRRLRGAVGAVALLSCAVLGWTGSAWEGIFFVAIMALFAGLSFFVLPERKRAAAIGLAALCAVASLLCSGRGPAAEGRPQHRDYDLSSQAKFLPKTWKGTLALNLSQPLLGSGPGSYWVRYPAFRTPEVILFEHKHNTETDHPENELLEQWTEGGLVSLGLWLWLFGALLLQGWRRLLGRDAGREDPVCTLGLFTALAAALLAMLLSSSSRYVMPGWLMYFVAGVLGVLACAESGPAAPVLAAPLPFGGGARRLLMLPVLAAALGLGWYCVRCFRSDIRHNVAIYHSKEGSWDKALQEYERVVPGSPAYVMSQYFAGNVLQDRADPGDLDRAVAQYQRVRALAPDYVNVHYQEGSALRKLGRKEEAIARFEAQAALDPVWDAPWRQLKELYSETGQPERAEAAARKEESAKEQWERNAP